MTQLHRMPGSNGFALVAALFLIIVLAALGLFAIKISSTQQQSIDLELLGARAQSAANSGIEYAANRVLKHGPACINTTLPLSQTSLNNFSVQISCASSDHKISGVDHQVYELKATATYGTYGTTTYVSRQQTRTVMN